MLIVAGMFGVHEPRFFATLRAGLARPSAWTKVRFTSMFVTSADGVARARRALWEGSGARRYHTRRACPISSRALADPRDFVASRSVPVLMMVECAESWYVVQLAVIEQPARRGTCVALEVLAGRMDDDEASTRRQVAVERLEERAVQEVVLHDEVPRSLRQWITEQVTGLGLDGDALFCCGTVCPVQACGCDVDGGDVEPTSREPHGVSPGSAGDVEGAALARKPALQGQEGGGRICGRTAAARVDGLPLVEVFSGQRGLSRWAVVGWDRVAYPAEGSATHPKWMIRT